MQDRDTKARGWAIQLEAFAEEPIDDDDLYDEELMRQERRK